MFIRSLFALLVCAGYAHSSVHGRSAQVMEPVVVNVGNQAKVREPTLYCQQKWVEMKWEGMKIHLYRLRAEAFPKGGAYKLVIHNSDGAQAEMFKYVANKKGHLIVELEEQYRKAGPLVVTPMRKGEKIGYAMVSEDGTQKVMTDLIPFPIEHKTHEVMVWAELQDIKGTDFSFHGKGFQPKEELHVTCLTEGQVAEFDVVAAEDGYFEMPLTPAIEGIETGKATVTVFRKKDKVSLSFDWGKQANEFVGACCLEIW